jgi:hypothetical protein
MKKQNIDHILDVILSNKEISYSDIILNFPKLAESTITRNLNKLIKN